MQDSLKKIWQRFLGRQAAGCAGYERVISLYADGMASPKEARLAEDHIAACPGCRALLSTIRVTTVAMADRPAPSLPDGLPERLRLAIAQEREREQTAKPALIGRRPARALAPRLALAGAFASVVLVAIAVHDLRSPSHSGSVATRPHLVASLPKTPPLAPAIHSIAPAVASAPKNVASSAIGSESAHTSAAFISHKRPTASSDRSESTRFAVAEAEPRGAAPPLVNVTDRHSAINHKPAPTHPQIASTPAPSAGRTSPVIVTHPPVVHHTPSTEIAKLPPATHEIAPATHEPQPPVINNPGGGEQPTTVAAAPQSEHATPIPAVAEDSPRIRLATRLKMIADSSAPAARQVVKVAAYEQHHTEYSGSLAIVGSSIR